MESKLPNFIPATWNLPPAIRARLGDQAGRQRVMDEDNHLLVILHEPPESADDQIRKPVVFWRDPGGQWLSRGRGAGLANMEELLIAYRDRIARLDDLVDSAKSPHDFFNLMREINPLLRSTRNQLVVMEAARKARPHERKLIILRDLAVENERGIDLIASDAMAGMNFSLAVAGENQAYESRIGNQEARRLNQLAAFFFPLATLASLLGMNDPGEMIASPGFWNVLIIGIALGLLLAIVNRVRLRRIKKRSDPRL